MTDDPHRYDLASKEPVSGERAYGNGLAPDTVLVLDQRVDTLEGKVDALRADHDVLAAAQLEIWSKTEVLWREIGGKLDAIALELKQRPTTFPRSVVWSAWAAVAILALMAGCVVLLTARSWTP